MTWIYLIPQQCTMLNTKQMYITFYIHVSCSWSSHSYCNGLLRAHWLWQPHYLYHVYLIQRPFTRIAAKWKFNIAAMVMQMQMRRISLKPWSVLVLASPLTQCWTLTLYRVTCEGTFTFTKCLTTSTSTTWNRIRIFHSENAMDIGTNMGETSCKPSCT